MFEKRFLKQVAQVFSRLSVPVLLLDGHGDAIYPEAASSHLLPENLAPGQPRRREGFLYSLVDTQPAMVLCCREGAMGAEDVLILADMLLQTLVQSGMSIADGNDVYRRALREEINGSELEALAHEHQIPMEMDRCVMLFHIVQTENTSALALLQELVPQAESDVLVEIDRHMVALLKDMETVDEVDDLQQFAQAVQETLLGETAHTMTVGIGEPRHNLASLGESYREARRAIEVGRVFQPTMSTYVFHRLMLERFLMELPRDISAYYHNLLFNRKTARLFNDEMLYTIEMFFKKDLNLSDTARQLYIHRNTLVYRLDKVQRQIGLDLRKFEDAVTFKILLELKKCGSEKPQQIH